MKMDSKRNAEHYPDPTAYEAIRNAERDLALFMDIALLSKCAELWVFGDVISSGIQKEIEYPRRKRKLIRYFTENCREEDT